ncbi:DUF4870 family protein [Crenobacter caeni]|uniref:Transmembrane protein n=1 Tax=Crenobacter caeni TaxID=2705474 RepID=A0A6B2KP26_9NEIS|nr:hypothetical protein [Crenobacter caeni]NDV11945.1 hypothetical protein [Crenobacter caeni]
MDYEVVSPDDRRFNNLVLLVYAIQAISLFTGLPAVIGLIINYLKLSEMRGTRYESHFRWQIRSFWWALAWSVLGGVLSLILVGYLVLGAVWLWFAYRVLRGFIALNDGRAMP